MDPSIILNIINLVIAVGAVAAAIHSNRQAREANRAAVEANELARRTHSDNIALQAPILTIEKYKLHSDGARVLVHNAGKTPASHVCVSLVNEISRGSVGREFDPWPRQVIEAGGDGQFFLPSDPKLFMERTRMGTELEVSWRDAVGQKYTEASPVALDPSPFVDEVGYRPGAPG